MAMDLTSIGVALISATGVISLGFIQMSGNRSSMKRADADTKRTDAARIDEREQDRLRREERQENDRLIRMEERTDALQRRKAEAEASREALRRSAENDVKAQMQEAAAQFVRQAAKILLAQQLLSPVGDDDWGALALTLADVISSFEEVDSGNAQAVVRDLQEASRTSDQVPARRLQSLHQAELGMTIFSRDARQTSSQWTTETI